MAGAFITTSRRGLLRPLACQGIFVTDCFHQISTLLQGLGPEHAALLAEPVHGAGGTANEAIDWYADASCGQAAPAPLASLPPEQRAAALLRIQQLATDIRRKADELTTGGDAHHALSGEMLGLALQHPAEEDIWMVGAQPVVINWGFAPGTVGAQPVDLSRLGTAPAVMPVTAAPVAPEPVVTAIPVAAAPRRGCLPWLLPLLLLLLLLALLLASLGIIPLPLPAGCSLLPPEDPRLADARAKERNLLEDMEKLRGQLAERAALCRPATPAKPDPAPVTPPAPEPQAEVPMVVEEPKEEPQSEPFLAMTPEEPAPKAEPKPQPKPKPEPAPAPKAEPVPKPEPAPVPKAEPKPEPKAKPKKNDPLSIPDDAKKNKDMAFLEGCWRSETDLFNSRTHEKLVAEYCFDKHGKGRRIIREKNGQVCNGGVTARFGADGALLMDSDQAHCARGGNYVPQRVECTGNNTSTNCKGNELGGRRNKWDARFYRK